MDCIEEIIALFESRARTAYLGEAVSQREHALQAAQLAVRDGAGDALVVAALLHDIGYLVGSGNEPHEQRGSDWLAQHFGQEVTEPVRLHVTAKRYLCSVDPAYSQCLSRASILSLHHQGGPLSIDESHCFELNRFHQDAIKVRRWDDLAKTPGLAVPEPLDYVPILRRVVIAPLQNPAGTKSSVTNH